MIRKYFTRVLVMTELINEFVSLSSPLPAALKIDAAISSVPAHVPICEGAEAVTA